MSDRNVMLAAAANAEEAKRAHERIFIRLDELKRELAVAEQAELAAEEELGKAHGAVELDEATPEDVNAKREELRQAMERTIAKKHAIKALRDRAPQAREAAEQARRAMCSAMAQVAQPLFDAKKRKALDLAEQLHDLLEELHKLDNAARFTTGFYTGTACSDRLGVAAVLGAGRVRLDDGEVTVMHAEREALTAQELEFIARRAEAEQR